MKLIRKMNVGASVFLILGVISSCWAELRLLMSLYRYGDRYPIGGDITKAMYPLNPHANVSFFPDSDAGLTMGGKNRSFSLGKILRAQYGDFLGDLYSSRLFEFRSDSGERNIATSLLVSAGLFPPRKTQRWYSYLDWQPIPTYTLPREEKVLFRSLWCSKYLAILKKTLSEDRNYIKYKREMKDFYGYVANKTGAKVNNRMLYYFYVENRATLSAGLRLPEWLEDNKTEQTIRDAAISEYRYSSSTTELQRYTGGVWINKWLEHVDDYILQEKRNVGVKKRAYFYSGHESNIVGIMITLGIYYPHVPNYASSLNFELHQDNDEEYYVKVLYKDADQFDAKIIPGCDVALCPLETFRKIVSPVTTSAENLECGALLFGNVP